MVSWTKPTKCMQECRRHRVLKPPCISAGTRGELCGCCGSERCSWQSCLWCCCRSGPRAEKNPAGDELNCMGHSFFQVQITWAPALSQTRSAQWVTVHKMVHWLFMYGEEQFHNPDLLLQKREGAYTGASHVLLHCTVQVQLHYSILSRGTLHHLLSRNIGLENGDREVGHLFCYYTGTVKTIRLSSRRVCTLYTTGQISRVHFLKSGYII